MSEESEETRRKRKSYTIKLKLEACEYAENSSNENAAKRFKV